ncbi:MULTISPECIES: type III secretion system translocator chaperone SicA [Rahnella]|jgi:type III secretion system low calcium response chaperone LcrH/SycD|uniref:type III secretion system translocator chaperone SicA n=1 Tax=Rahnella TaxID=34037 RepID=UPI003D2845E4
MANKNMLDLLNDEEEFKSDEQLDAYAESLLDAIQNGATLKDVYAVPNDTMQDVYKLAYDFYHHGKLDDAESLFRFLCIYDFYNPEYAMGLAAVYQLKKNYAKAIEFYALAYSLSKEDFRPMFYAGQCNLMLRQSVQARKCFDIVISRCKDALLSEKAKAYISALNKINNDKADTPEEEKLNEE